MEDVKLVLEAPNVYTAAAVLIKQKFFLGKGDRSSFIEVVLASDPTKIPDLARKLKLLTAIEFSGFKIYNDKLCSTLNICQQSVYKLWMHCCRSFEVMTVDQMIDFAPYMAEKLKLWDKFVDKQGKTTLNVAEYIELRKQIAEKKKLQTL